MQILWRKTKFSPRTSIILPVVKIRIFPRQKCKKILHQCIHEKPFQKFHFWSLTSKWQRFYRKMNNGIIHDHGSTWCCILKQLLSFLVIAEHVQAERFGPRSNVVDCILYKVAPNAIWIRINTGVVWCGVADTACNLGWYHLQCGQHSA